jgi:polysaccharide biosynthesis/export protein
MKIRPSGIPYLHVHALLLVFFTGCQSPNFYHAESLPRSLQLARQFSAQEVDLGSFAHVTGTSETIGPGDILELSISASLNQEDQVNIPVRIGNDGTAKIPDIGTIALGGVEPQAAEALIRMEAINRGQFRNPTVTVSFAHKKKNVVRVLGAVKVEGTYELSPGSSDIVSAIAAAGGLADNAGQKVDVRNPADSQAERASRRAVAGGAGRSDSPFSTVSDPVEISGGMTTYSVNLASARTASTHDYQVLDGGVVMVEKRDPTPITVSGLVKRSDTYPFPVGKDLTVLGAIAMAGGESSLVADKVFVIRPLANSKEPALIQVSLRKAKRNGKSNILLGPGDTVLVESTPSTMLWDAVQLIRIGVNGTAGIF